MEKSTNLSLKQAEKPKSIPLDRGISNSVSDLRSNISESASLPKRPPLPVINETVRSDVIELLPSVRADVQMFRFSWEYLRTVRPEAFQGLDKRNPWLASRIEKLEEIVKGIDPKELQPDKIVQKIDEYNRLAESVNIALSAFERDLPQGGINSFLLSSEDKVELQRFVKDLWKELFPESTIAATTRYYTWQAELEGYQKILLAPAEGIEGLIRTAYALTQPSTYKELSQWIQTGINMDSDERKACLLGLNLLYGQLSTADKVSQVVALIYGIAFLLGGIAKISQVLKAARVPAFITPFLKTLPFWNTLRHTNAAMVALPIAIIANLRLHYIESPQLKSLKDNLKQ